MDDTFVVTNLDQLKALADTLRQSILGMFCCQPATTKQIADQLGEKPTRLYHHVDLLEKAGLIELVETRPNRGTVEKYYQTVAKQFLVDRKLLRAEDAEEVLTETQNSLITMLEECITEAHGLPDLQIAKDDEAQPMCLSKMRLRLTQEQAREFSDRICDWLGQCCPTESSDNTGDYTLTVAFFPVHDDDSRDDDQKCC